MEALVLIKEVGAYSERQYQRQDGTTEYFRRDTRMHCTLLICRVFNNNGLNEFVCLVIRRVL